MYKTETKKFEFCTQADIGRGVEELTQRATEDVATAAQRSLDAMDVDKYRADAWIDSTAAAYASVLPQSLKSSITSSLALSLAARLSLSLSQRKYSYVAMNFVHHLTNFRRLVCGCMDSYDSEPSHILQHFSSSTR